MDTQLAQVAQFEWGPDHQVTGVNGAFELVLGVTEESLLGKSIAEALGISAERVQEIETGLSETTSKVEFVHGRVDGKPRIFRAVLRRDGSGVRACLTDLEAMLDQAPPVQISRLSSSLSHEIRNPLSSVKMAVQTLARNANLSERDQRRLAIANREIRTVERMLWLLSEYGRDMFPNVDELPLRAIIHEAAALVGPELAERKVLLRIDEPTEAPRARVDVGRLRPVLAQLLLNVAAGQGDGSTLVATLGFAADGGSTMVLEDSSATLQPEEKESVFEPFGSMLARGAGLSLAALYQVMKSHRGNVTAEAANPGTRYTLRFPPP